MSTKRRAAWEPAAGARPPPTIRTQNVGEAVGRRQDREVAREDLQRWLQFVATTDRVPATRPAPLHASRVGSLAPTGARSVRSSRRPRSSLRVPGRPCSPSGSSGSPRAESWEGSGLVGQLEIAAQAQPADSRQPWLSVRAPSWPHIGAVRTDFRPDRLTCQTISAWSRITLSSLLSGRNMCASWMAGRT